MSRVTPAHVRARERESGMSWSFDDDSQPSGNSTCSEFSTCSGCIDYFDPDGVGCLWCNVPKDASSLPSAGGLCLPRLRAQDSCEIGELQATCQEGAGWYVLVLTLSALLCCCCFLTMARKFAAMWHERWWLASGGELSTPLLDEDGEEQQHEVIFRSSLADAAGTSSWRCPVCAFDNRPRCKHCDLCGMSSEFAEVYWKDRDASKRRGDGARSKKRTEASVEEGKATAGGEAKPQTPPADDATNATADSGEAGENRSSGGGRGGGSGGAGRRGGRGQTVGGTRGSTEDPDGNTRLKRGGTEGTGWGESGGGAGAAGDVEEEPEATPLLSGGDGDGSGSSGGGGGGSGDEASPSAEIDGDMGGDEEEGDGNGRGAGRRVGASLGGETSEGGKPRRAPFRMRRLGNLTERQKRARRRRIWQRVIGPDGSQRWLQSVENPAASLAAASAAAAAAAAPAASGYQPPSLSPALSPSSAATAASAAAAASSETGARRGRGGVPAVAAAAAANAAAVLLYWTSRPRRAAASTSSSSGAAGGGGGPVDSASEPLLSEAQQQQYEASTSIGGGGTVSGGARGGDAGDAGDSLLSAVERGEGAESRRSSFASSSPPSLKRGREGSGGSDDWFRVSPSGSGAGGAGGAGVQERGGGGGGGGRDSGRNGGSGRREKGKVSPAVKTTTAVAMEAATLTRCDSFGDEVMASKCPGYYVTFLEGGGLALDEAHDGEPVVQPHPLPPSATRRGPLAGEGTATITPPPPPSAADDRSGSGGGGAGRGRGGGGVSGGGGGGISIGSHGFGLGTGPSARPGVAGGGGVYGEGTARRREARREEAASEEWISSTRKEVVKLCDVASRPFWQKHSWFLDQLKLLQVPHGAGMEAMRIEVNRKNLLEDSYAQVSAMNVGELRRWLRVQFVGEPGVDAGGLEREWFMLVCSALFDPSTGLFTPQPGNGAFAINPSSGVANEMHLEYFRFTGRVLGKLLMEHSVVPYHLSLPILKHLLGLPVAFSDLEFADPELHRNLQWLSTNPGAESLGLDFTVTMESFGVKEIVELVPGGKDIAVTDGNKEHYLQLRLRHRVLDGTHGQLWHLMRGLYDVIPSHLISVFDYQELELLLCGIPEIDVSEWKRCSRYLGDYRRAGENHMVIKWFWEVVEAFSEEEKARFLQFCTGSSRLPAHGFKALQSNDGSFRAFSLQSITKRDSAFPRAHTCFNKLDLPTYESKKELEECLGLCICFELTGFTID